MNIISAWLDKPVSKRTWRLAKIGGCAAVISGIVAPPIYDAVIGVRKFSRFQEAQSALLQCTYLPPITKKQFDDNPDVAFRALVRAEVIHNNCQLTILKK